MSLASGGRPREEGGHKRLDISIDEQIYKALEKIHDKGENRSKFIENALRPLIRQLDPGESCEVLRKIDENLSMAMVSALQRKDFEKVVTLATIGNALAPFKDLCEPDSTANSRELVLEHGKSSQDNAYRSIGSLPESKRKASCVCEL